MKSYIHKQLMLCLSIVVLTFFSVRGQAQSSQDLQNVLTALSDFQTDIRQLESAASTPLGPYNLDVRYEWCSKHFIFCIENSWETFTWTVDFNWTKRGLQNAVSRARSNASNFSNSYAPTQRWVDNLPAFSRRFSANVNQIEQIKQQVQASSNPPTPQQRQTVIRALEQINQDLQNSKNQINSGVRSLTSFLQQQSAYRDQIKSTMNATNQQQQKRLEEVRNEARKTVKQPGTFDLINKKLSAIQTDFNNSARSISTAFTNVESSSKRAETGIGQLLGKVISDSGQLSEVIKKVKAAQAGELFSFIQSLQLSAAKRQWEELARNTSSINDFNTATTNNTLTAGQSLYNGQKLSSPNGKYYLIAQTDGNVVVYKKENNRNVPIWATGTHGKSSNVQFIMQTDGNLVVYDRPSKRALWSSRTQGFFDPKFRSSTYKPIKLVLKNNGTLVLISKTNNNSWTSKD